MNRDEFMEIVYEELQSDPDNNRANRIIDAADEYAEYEASKREAEQDWVSVEERLPEDPSPYTSIECNVTYEMYGGKLKTTTMNFVKEKVRGKTVKRWRWKTMLSPWTVIAWKPLPKPYDKKIMKEVN